MLSAGAQAPLPTFQTPDGGRESLAELLAAGPVLLVFYKISCPTCQLAMPYLDRVAGGEGLRVVAVSQNAADGTAAFEKRFRMTRISSLVEDEGAGFAGANAFEVTHVPSQFLIEPDGRISRSWSGFSRQDVEAAGERAGVAPFGPGEQVPNFKAG
ncbi:MAG: TlpA disulfide reductase family protein [Bryobacteraceae bacterium]